MKTHLVGRPVMPFSWYGPGRVASIVPAISRCAHLNVASFLSFSFSFPSSLSVMVVVVDSIPSTNALRKSAAVQEPPGRPPVCVGEELKEKKGIVFCE